MARGWLAAAVAISLAASAPSAHAAARTITGSVVFSQPVFSGSNAVAYGAVYNVTPGAPVTADFSFTFDDAAIYPPLQPPGGIEASYAVSHAKLAINGVTAFDAAPVGQQARLLTASYDGMYSHYSFGVSFTGDLAPDVEGLEAFQFFYAFTLDEGVAANGVPTAAAMDGHILQTGSNVQIATHFPYVPADGLSYASVSNGRITVLEAGVPEPSSWALMLAGFGLAGGALRARRRALA